MGSFDDFGVLLPTRGVLVYAGRGNPKVELNWQMAETAERLGYDSVWVGDSVTSKPRLEPLTIMAALAARTNRVKIGTAVMLTALRHPVHLAHAVATIDNISNGRVILGAGAGRGDGGDRPGNFPSGNFAISFVCFQEITMRSETRPIAGSWPGPLKPLFSGPAGRDGGLHPRALASPP